MSAAGGANVPPLTTPMELRRFGHPDSLLELELQVQELLDRPAAPIPVPEPFVLANSYRETTPTNAAAIKPARS